jgi:hypothetical protein
VFYSRSEIVTCCLLWGGGLYLYFLKNMNLIRVGLFFSFFFFTSFYSAPPTEPVHSIHHLWVTRSEWLECSGSKCGQEPAVPNLAECFLEMWEHWWLGVPGAGESVVSFVAWRDHGRGRRGPQVARFGKVRFYLKCNLRHWRFLKNYFWNNIKVTEKEQKGMKNLFPWTVCRQLLTWFPISLRYCSGFFL